MEAHNLFDAFAIQIKDRNLEIEDLDYLTFKEIVQDLDPHLIDELLEHVESLEYEDKEQESVETKIEDKGDKPKK